MKESIKLIPEVFFDFFSYFLPGIFLWLPLTYVLINKGIFSFIAISNFEKILIILLGSYICGHMLTTLSNLFVVKPVNYLLGDPIYTMIGIDEGKFKKSQYRLDEHLVASLSRMIRVKFKSELNKHTFFLCENYIRINYPDIGFLIRKRHAFEHLCRNLAIASFFLLITLSVLYSSYGIKIPLIVIVILSLIRYFDYRISWPKVVYENFYLLCEQNEWKSKTDS